MIERERELTSQLFAGKSEKITADLRLAKSNSVGFCDISSILTGSIRLGPIILLSDS